MYLVFLFWSLCLLYATGKRAHLPYFLFVAGLALHIATRRSNNSFFFLVVKNNLQSLKIASETLKERKSSAPFSLAVVSCFIRDEWFALPVPPKQPSAISLQ